MKIGIPNTLFAAYHLPYWQQFLNHLNVDVVVSDDSRKETIDAGGKLIPHEFCVPIKAFLGHVVNLITKNVDLILVPRMLSKGNRNFFCPKLIGLPEIVRHAAGIDDSRLFSPEVICNGLNLKMIHYPHQKVQPKSAFNRAKRQAGYYWEQAMLKCRQENLMISQVFRYNPSQGLPDPHLLKADENPVTISKDITGRIGIKRPQPDFIRLGLLGYAYALYDPFISKGLVNKLSGLGAQLFTWEMIDSKLIENQLGRLKRPLFWNFGRILLGAGLHFLKEPGVDGIVYATTFGCGPDSIAIQMLSQEAAVAGKPFLQITLDEHSEDGHLKTRLEAFMDLLSAQKEEKSVESHLPLSGSGAGV